MMRTNYKLKEKEKELTEASNVIVIDESSSIEEIELSKAKKKVKRDVDFQQDKTVKAEN